MGCQSPKGLMATWDDRALQGGGWGVVGGLHAALGAQPSLPLLP